jgi:Tol biopolymer transport system component
MSQYSGFERKIAFLLTKFPGIKQAIKKMYQKINYARYKKNYTFKSKYNIKPLTIDAKESFFGYYDKSPINSTNKFIIFQVSNTDTKKMPNSNISVDLVVYDIKNDKYEIIDQSCSYNWQQGTKLMWLNKYEFIYNDYDKNRDIYISKIYNIQTKKFEVIDFPIYDCFEDKFSISLNFDRLNIGRADYSYSNRKDKIDWTKNDNDGLYYIDLANNNSKLILTIETIIKNNFKDTMASAKHKFNHIMISPNGKKVMFMHRWFTTDNRRYDTLYVSNIDGSELKIVADDDMVSHCYWADDENIFAYLRDKDMGDKFYMISIFDTKKQIVGEGTIDKFGDGHPSINNNKILFDTYPNKARMKELFIYNKDKDNLENIGEFFESFDFYGETRCDLHPRFSFDGKKVFFDSVHSGQRQLYMMELVI